MDSKSLPSDKDVDVRVVTLDTESSDLGHVPKVPYLVRFKKFGKSLVSRDAWFGDYVSCCSRAHLTWQDYLSLLIPNIPYLFKKRELDFYGVDDHPPYLLVVILGLQQ